MQTSQYLKICQRRDILKKKISRLKGNLDQLKIQLKLLGPQDMESGNSLLKKLQLELSELQDQLSKAIKELESKWPDRLSQ